jgi:hypothetical protein
MEESVAILKALASGFDPRSGEEFAERGGGRIARDRRFSQAAEALEAQLRRHAARLEKHCRPPPGNPGPRRMSD